MVITVYVFVYLFFLISMTLGSHVAFFYFLSSQKRFMYLRAVIVSLYIGLHLLL